MFHDRKVVEQMGSKVARTQSPMVSMHSPTFASIHVWNWLKSYASVVDFYRSWNYAVSNACTNTAARDPNSSLHFRVEQFVVNLQQKRPWVVVR